MTCRDMDDFISSQSGNSVRGPQPAEHLICCEHCYSLTHLLNKADDGLRPSESLLRRIEARILEDLSPIRPLAPFRLLLFACAIVFLSVVMVGALLLGMNGWGALNLVQRIVVFAALAASAVVLAIAMVRLMVPGGEPVLAPRLLIAILVAIMMVLAVTFHAQQEPAFLVSGLMCVKNGLMYSMPAGFLLWLIQRRGAILNPKLSGAVAGGLAGLAGLSVLEVNCSNLNVFHILVWHAGVVPIGSLGGVLLGTAVESIQRWRMEGF